ncbi:hypothetical protein EIP91_009897 [Steccherinum ochraceum]|uniref:Uncharacterized protein n=1 Tax=Steccherinum ochraceum TaxID=92696 RepID=A0A4R0RJX8_9APHY|nr:hypothetical protein EIP91_009897 [Steccherinum ochraceum]
MASQAPDPGLNFFDEYDSLGNVPDVDEPHAAPFYQNWIFYPVVCVTLLVVTVLAYLAITHLRRPRVGSSTSPPSPTVSGIRGALASTIRHLTPLKKSSRASKQIYGDLEALSDKPAVDASDSEKTLRVDLGGGAPVTWLPYSPRIPSPKRDFGDSDFSKVDLSEESITATSTEADITDIVGTYLMVSHSMQTIAPDVSSDRVVFEPLATPLATKRQAGVEHDLLIAPFRYHKDIARSPSTNDRHGIGGANPFEDDASRGAPVR